MFFDLLLVKLYQYFLKQYVWKLMSRVAPPRSISWSFKLDKKHVEMYTTIQNVLLHLHMYNNVSSIAFVTRPITDLRFENLSRNISNLIRNILCLHTAG